MKSALGQGAKISSSFLANKSQGFRFFSAISFQLPDGMNNEFEKVHSLSTNNKIVFPSSDVTKRSVDLTLNFLEKHKTSCADSAKMLSSISRVLSDDSITAVYAENTPKQKNAPIFFSDLLSALLNLEPQIKERTLHYLNPAQQQTDYIPPHTDGIYSRAENELTGVTLFGRGEAKQKLHTTFVIDLDKIVKNLSAEQIQILHQEIYVRGFSGGVVLSPILRTGLDQKLRISYSGNDSESVFDDKKSLWPAHKVHQSLESLNESIEGLFRDKKIAEFQITDGSTLLVFNTRALHGRHLNGSTSLETSRLSGERRLFGLDYTIAKDQLIKFSETSKIIEPTAAKKVSNQINNQQTL